MDSFNQGPRNFNEDLGWGNTGNEYKNASTSLEWMSQCRHSDAMLTLASIDYTKVEDLQCSWDSNSHTARERYDFIPFSTLEETLLKGTANDPST